MLYLVFFIVLVCLTWIFFINVKIEIEYIRNGWNEVASIKISIMRNLIKFKYEIPYYDISKDGFKFKRNNKGKNIKGKNKKGKNNKGKNIEQINKDNKTEENQDKKNENGTQRFSELLDRIEYYRDKYDKLNYLMNNSLMHLKKRLKLSLFKVSMVIGTGDACWTGVLGGFAWILVGFITSLLSNSFGIKEKNIDIKSDFSKPVFKVYILCIFNIRFGNVISAAIVVIFKTIGRRCFKCRNILYRVL